MRDSILLHIEREREKKKHYTDQIYNNYITTSLALEGWGFNRFSGHIRIAQLTML